MKALPLVASLLALVPAAASAETLTIPLGTDSPPNSPQGVPRPVRGMTMDVVLARFGEPTTRLPAVGEPPITRWVYERFIVYYEWDRVLHAVVTRKPG